jgi:type 1 glutamine amidotransferase
VRRALWQGKPGSLRSSLCLLCFGLLSVFSHAAATGRTSHSPRPVEADAILVYSRTTTYRHESIAAGVAAIRRQASHFGLRVIAGEDPALLTDAVLRAVAVVVFLNTTGDVADEPGQAAIERYVRHGGAFLGIHAASDTEYGWPWYQDLVGGVFKGHPYGASGELQLQDARLIRVADVPCQFAHLPRAWRARDEWYNFRTFSDGIRPIVKLDTSTYTGSAHPGDHPIAWVREYDGGRSAFLGMGHDLKAFDNRNTRSLLRSTIAYLLDIRRGFAGCRR